VVREEQRLAVCEDGVPQHLELWQSKLVCEEQPHPSEEVELRRDGEVSEPRVHGRISRRQQLLLDVRTFSKHR